MNMKKISIVIPAYNESNQLPLTIDEIFEVVEKLNDYRREIIIIND
jgi:glycosyltransferase involved in cell wall biosynthesis